MTDPSTKSLFPTFNRSLVRKSIDSQSLAITHDIVFRSPLRGHEPFICT